MAAAAAATAAAIAGVSTASHPRTKRVKVTSSCGPPARRLRPARRGRGVRSSSAVAPPALEGRGGKMVVELVGAFNDLAERMDGGAGPATSSSARLLFRALTLAIRALRAAPEGRAGRSRLSRALAVASTLADLHMDVEVISASMLREAVEAGTITTKDVKLQMGASVAYLLHESFRLKQIPSKVDMLDDDGASAIRKFCIGYYDIRAVIMELALMLDTMRYISCLPRYHQQAKSLEVMKIYAPLAHAVGAGALSHELEDLSFRHLFPRSYVYIDRWLKHHESDSRLLLDACKDRLLRALKEDSLLDDIVDGVTVRGRFKSRFSMMKKLLKDGRKPDEVYDVLGLRVIFDGPVKWGEEACYRAHEVIKTIWREVPDRTKDYIARPKANGYRSLHVAVDVSEPGKMRPLLEIQIRTLEMDRSADVGSAAHSSYKGGLTDPEESRRLKAIMVTAAELAALRLRDLDSSGNHSDEAGIERRNHVFYLLDKNRDGRISITELSEVMEDLGAASDDAKELMHLLDANSDGSLSAEEFESFQRQVELARNLENKDDHCRSILVQKLEEVDTPEAVEVLQMGLRDVPVMS